MCSACSWAPQYDAHTVFFSIIVDFFLYLNSIFWKIDAFNMLNMWQTEMISLYATCLFLYSAML